MQPAKTIMSRITMLLALIRYLNKSIISNKRFKSQRSRETPDAAMIISTPSPQHSTATHVCSSEDHTLADHQSILYKQIFDISGLTFHLQLLKSYKSATDGVKFFKCILNSMVTGNMNWR